MFMRHNHPRGHERRGPRFIGRILAGIAIAVLFGLAFGIFVQMLWNWLMPATFGLGKITYLQAFGLILLARLLFGSMGHHHKHAAGYAAGRYGFPWRGHGCATEDAANGDIRDWRHYDAWWQAEGREAFRKYIDSRRQGKEAGAS